MQVIYSSNNSGGSWWLSDDQWRALEGAGWSVDWRPERWLGALATVATRSGLSRSEAILEWAAATGEDPSDPGCSCCGPPHNFYEDHGDEDSNT